MSAGRNEKGTKMKLRAALAAMAFLCAGPSFALGRLADLSVYDRTQGVQLPVHWHHGRAYIVGRPGNEYQIALKNRSGEDLLAVVSVDGINVVSGETADPGQGGYVLDGYRSYDILGWRKSLQETAAFYFTSLADSYAARTGRADNAGVIGIALFRRKPQPPALNLGLAQGAPASPAKREAATDSPAQAAEQSRLGTGHGRRESSVVSQVEFERASAMPAETVTIYYDSYRNLVARGVIREPIAPIAPLPRPFPGFVPDPPRG